MDAFAKSVDEGLGIGHGLLSGGLQLAVPAFYRVGYEAYNEESDYPRAISPRQ